MSNHKLRLSIVCSVACEFYIVVLLTLGVHPQRGLQHLVSLCVCVSVTTFPATMRNSLARCTPKIATVHVSAIHVYTDKLHCCCINRHDLWLKHLAPGYKSIITPHYHALEMPKGRGLQITQWGVAGPKELNIDETRK